MNNGGFMKDILDYIKGFSIPKKIIYIILLLLFTTEMWWALSVCRIYHTCVPIKNWFDIYVLAFPFMFAFFNILIIIKKQISGFYMTVGFVLLITYPPALTALCFLIDRIHSFIP